MQDNDPPVYSGQPFQPPVTPVDPPWWKKALAPLGVVGVVILKFLGQIKLFILPLIKFLPVLLKTGGSMIFMIWIYALNGGWPFAIGFVLLIFVHESGHLIAARMMGLKVGAPVFIPFMGALIALKEAPRNAWIESFVAIGGPVAGAAGAAACNFIYVSTGDPFWASLANIGYFLNLFNLIPFSPLDGGRIATAISPWLWLPGLGILGWVLVTQPMGLFSFVLIWILFSGGARMISFFRRRGDEEAARYYELTPGQRWTMALAYFALAGLLALGMHEMTQVLEASSNWRLESPVINLSRHERIPVCPAS